MAELRLPDPRPIADYVRSMSGTQHSADPERLVAEVVARFPAAPGAVLTITTHTGCLICTSNRGRPPNVTAPQPTRDGAIRPRRRSVGYDPRTAKLGRRAVRAPLLPRR